MDTNWIMIVGYLYCGIKKWNQSVKMYSILQIILWVNLIKHEKEKKSLTCQMTVFYILREDVFA